MIAFDYTEKNGSEAVCWGYGCLYNHCSNPNVSFTRDYANKKMIFTANRNIKQGEELFIDYDWDVDCKTPKWFLDEISHKNC